MRVLSLTTIYPNEQVVHEGRSVAFLDRALAKLGAFGTTLVLKPWVPYWVARRVAKWRHLAVRRRVEERDGVTVIYSHYLHIPIRYRLDQCVASMAQRTIRLIERHRIDFDLIHGECIYPAALAARLVANHYRVPFITTLRDDLSHLTSTYERLGARELFEPMFASVAAIFVIGPAQQRDVMGFLPAGAHPPVILAPNGVDVDGIEAILQSIPAPQQHPWGRIVSVSNLYRYKGIHENLCALKEIDARGIKDWHYTVVGNGPFRRELESLAQELGIGDRVLFTGQLSHRDAIREINESDVFSLPSWAEAFGNVYAEAAVCRRPSIGCRGFGAEMTIRDGETGLLVTPKDVNALADALAFLLTNPQRARTMGQAAGEHVRQFTWERTARLYRDAIEQVLRKGKTPSAPRRVV